MSELVLTFDQAELRELPALSRTGRRMELVLHRQCRPRVDIDRLPWLDSVIASGVPAEYGEMLQTLTETIASGRGSRPNGDVQKVTGAPPS